MNDNPSFEQQLNRTPPPRAKIQPYDFMLGKSRLIGRVAVQAFSEVREFLNREVRTPGTGKLASSVRDLGRKILPDKPNIHAIAAQSHEVLDSAKSVFPFMLFPDSLVLDRTKITIVKRTMFSEDITTIRIEDVLNVAAHTGIMFASLNIASRVMNSTDHFQVRFLWVHDALRLKRLIQGYVIAQHNDIKVAHLQRSELLATLNEIGQDQAL